MSKRQRECLKGVAEHLDSQQIGERLGISPHTVDGHIASAIAALGARSRRDAVRILAGEAGHLLTGEFPPVAGPSEFTERMSPTQIVRETPTDPPFGYPDDPTPDGGTRNNDLGRPLRTIALIFAVAAAAAILLLAIGPLTEGAMKLANAIQPYRH